MKMPSSNYAVTASQMPGKSVGNVRTSERKSDQGEDLDFSDALKSDNSDDKQSRLLKNEDDQGRITFKKSQNHASLQANSDLLKEKNSNTSELDAEEYAHETSNGCDVVLQPQVNDNQQLPALSPMQLLFVSLGSFLGPTSQNPLENASAIESENPPSQEQAQNGMISINSLDIFSSDSTEKNASISNAAFSGQGNFSKTTNGAIPNGTIKMNDFNRLNQYRNNLSELNQSPVTASPVSEIPQSTAASQSEQAQTFKIKEGAFRSKISDVRLTSQSLPSQHNEAQPQHNEVQSDSVDPSIDAMMGVQTLLNEMHFSPQEGGVAQQISSIVYQIQNSAAQDPEKSDGASAAAPALQPPEPQQTASSLSGSKRMIVLELKPESLGSIRLNIQISGDKIRMRIQTQHGEAVEAISNARSELHAILKQQGLISEQITVSHQSWINENPKSDTPSSQLSSSNENFSENASLGNESQSASEHKSSHADRGTSDAAHDKSASSQENSLPARPRDAVYL